MLFDHHGRQDQQPPYALEPRLELLSWSAIAAVAKEQGHDAARTRVQLEYEVRCNVPFMISVVEPECCHQAAEHRKGSENAPVLQQNLKLPEPLRKQRKRQQAQCSRQWERQRGTRPCDRTRAKCAG